MTEGLQPPRTVVLPEGAPPPGADAVDIKGDGAFDLPGTTSGATVMRGGIWTAVSRMIPQVYTLIISLVAARFLGPDGMGRQSFIAFVELSTMQLFTGGLSLGMMRNIGEALGAGRAGAVRAIISWGWRLQAIGCVGGVLVLGGAAAFGAEPTAAWVLAAVACFMGVMHTVPSAVLIGMQRWRDASIVGLVTGSIAVPATIAVLAAGGGIAGIFAVEAATTTMNLIWTTRLARRSLDGLGDGNHDPGSDYKRQIVRYTLATTVTMVLGLIVYRRSEFFFLEHYSTNSEIAFYSIAFSAMSAVVLLPEAFGGALAPAIATLVGAGDHERIRSGYSRALRLAIMAALPLTAAIMTLVPPLIELVYGRAYADTRGILIIMAIIFPILPLLNMGNGLMLGLGKMRVPVIASFVAAFVNVGLDFALIPDHAAKGAAVANAAAQTTVAVILVLYIWRLLGGIVLRPLPIVLSALASAAAAAAALAVLAAAGTGVPGVIAASVAFVLALLGAGRILRFLPSDDAAWLTENIRGRGRKPLARLSRLLSG
ncbi:MAG TPA: MATE family efflux transporter [Thermoleophilaceae bacterium]